MAKYLIDANLPYYFSMWNSDMYEHIVDIDPHMKDSAVWSYAEQHNLTIITKDADFSERVQILGAPPRVIHIRLGNMKMNAFHSALGDIWEDVLSLSETHDLINVYWDRIEGIG